jgi:hypothetical protein
MLLQIVAFDRLVGENPEMNLAILAAAVLDEGNKSIDTAI